jgi:hypothetical protein
MKLTEQDLITEVRYLVQQAMDANKVEQETLDEAMIHMIANFKAEDFFNMLQPKELAEIIKDGLSPVDMNKVIEYISDQHEMIISPEEEDERLMCYSLFVKRVEYFWWLVD